MPQIPDRRDLGRVQVSGADRPNEINPMVAYDIGRAGQAWNQALGEIERAFGSLALKKQKTDDDGWLADRKIETLKQEDELRRETDLNAGEDGSGYEEVPQRYKGIVEGQEQAPGGSEEARTKYKTWAAERAYETGRWGVNTSQARLKQFHLNKLDRRLDEMTNLTATNPQMSAEYFKAYEEEVKSQIGSTIDAPSAALRIERARQNILKVGVIEKAKRKPADYAKALKALDDAGLAPKSQDRLPQDGVSRNDTIGKISREVGVPESTMRLFVKIESGGDPKARTGKYKGSLQLSDEEFQKYGGGDIFNEEDNLRAGGKKLKAQMDAFEAKTGRKPSNLDLYLIHQQGEGGAANHMKNPDAPAWKNMAATAEGRKKGAAWAKQAIWGNIPDDVKGQFPGGVETVTSRQFIGTWANKVDRLSGASKAPSMALETNVRLRELPQVDGSIQPAELMSLKPEDFYAVTGQIKPFLAAEMEEKVKDASAALMASGTQSVLSDEELKLAPLIAGPKVAEKWKGALDEALDVHNIITSSKQMTGAERRQHIAAIRPSDDAGAASEEEKQHFERWVKVDAELTKMMKANPVEYFGTQNESGKAALGLIASSPPDESGLKAREKAYDVLLQLQRQEGLDAKDITLLPKDSAERIVNEMMSAKTGPAAIAQLDTLRNQYGRHFNTVWGQLQRAGAPDAFLAMPAATTRGQNGLIETYILERSLAESAGKDADKGNLLRERAGVKRDDLTKAVNDEVGELTSAMDPLAFTLRESYRNAAERLTLYHMIANGKSVGAAARAAADDLYRNSLSVTEGVIVPNAEYGTGTQRLDLTNGLRNSASLIRSMSDQIIAQVPPNRFGQSYSKSRYVESVADTRRFVTSNDSKGVHLLDMSNGRVMIDTSEGPKPLFLSWEQLRQIGRDTAFSRSRSSRPFSD